LPLLERVRVEVYLPDPHSAEYENLLQLLREEFTYAFGGCSIVRGMEGSYLSIAGTVMPDRIDLIYSDVPLALSLDFSVVAGYARELKRVAMEALAEEAVLITVEKIYHAV
jgi:hypothetical protein